MVILSTEAVDGTPVDQLTFSHLPNDLLITVTIDTLVSSVSHDAGSGLRPYRFEHLLQS